MNVDITIDEKSLDAVVTFKLADFANAKSLKDALAIVMMIAGDFSLDPEMELEDLEEIVAKGNEDAATKLIFFINEDEIEAELVK